MVDGEINYREFTRKQLLEALTRIDRARYPLNLANLTREIDARAPEENQPSDTIKAAAKSGFQAHLTFTGTGAEYFRIWVVHVLLTVLSFGIYSAWAKVRKARWFAQHTQLLGDPFDYHGRPRRILLGRVIALGLLIAYSFSFDWSPAAGLTVLGLLLVLGPALYGAAQRFRLTNTSWRGLRFGFEASPRTVYAVCIPLVLVWSSGTVWAGVHGSLKGVIAVNAVSALAWPAVHASLKSMQHERTRYGEQRFAFRPAIGAFYALYAGAVGIAVIIGLLMLPIDLIIRAIASLASGANRVLVGIILGATMMALTYIVVGSYFMAELQKLVWSHTTFGELRFGSTIQESVLRGLVARNLLLVLLTAGVYWPFAAVAIARYRVQSITVESDGPPPEIAAPKHGNTTAVGDAALDLFGLDLGW
jgi:uncharacterized membrane protein YjgN (DUF898 family)